MRLRLPPILIASCLMLAATPAFAYIGPGAGITMLSAIWGVIVALAMAVAAVLFWPIRVLLRRRRKLEAPTAARAPGEPRSFGKLEAAPPTAGESH